MFWIKIRNGIDSHFLAGILCDVPKEDMQKRMMQILNIQSYMYHSSKPSIMLYLCALVHASNSCVRQYKARSSQSMNYEITDG